MELLEPAVKSFVAGDPADPTTQMGPLISAAQRERVRSYVSEDAPAAIRGEIPKGKASGTRPPSWRDGRTTVPPWRRSSARSPS